MGEITLRDLFPKDSKYTFLVGAGCSIDSPSCLPAGKPMVEAIIRYSCAEKEVDNILGLENLRFEQLVEIVRDRLDPGLKIIDFYGLCDTPNTNHFFLAEMMKRGYFVITTNFDYLIEYALLQSGMKEEQVIPVITKEDYEYYADPQVLVSEKKYPVYKIHGSSRNIITDSDTKNSLVATIQAFGSGKEGESVFQLEPHKRSLFENVSNGRTLVVMGYSGSDDFDIVPTLKQLRNLTRIVWIEHVSKESIPDIQTITSDTNVSKDDKVGLILQEIRQMGYGIELFRMKSHLAEVRDYLYINKNNISTPPFKLEPLDYLTEHIESPDGFIIYQIPYEIYNMLSLVDDAERCAREVLDQVRTSSNLKWKSIALTNIGSLLYEKSELDEALHYLKESLVIAEQLGELRIKATALNNIGFLLNGKGEPDEALHNFKEALVITEQLGDLRAKSAYLTNIGSLLGDKGELDEALHHHKEALAIDEQLGDLRGKATRLNNIGLLLYGKGELGEALRYYKEALAIDEQLGDLRGKATCLNNIGLLLYGKGELDKALHHYKEGLAIAEQLGDLRMKSKSLNNIGLLLFGKGELDDPLRYYKEALTIDEQLGDLRGKATCLNNIGLLLHEKGALDEALRYYKEALPIAEKLGDLRGKATRLNNIGLLLHEKGALDGALRYYKEALPIAEKLGDLRMKSGSLNNIGSLLADKGELDEALHYYKEALAIDDQLGDLRCKAIDFNNISHIQQKKGDINGALRMMQEALIILEQIGAGNSLDAEAFRKSIAILKEQTDSH